MTAIGATMSPEIHARMNAMKAVHRTVRGKFLKAPGVAVDAKQQFVQACMLSKGLFQAGTWPELYANEYKK
eukprot:4594358-Karenia_brevis.AAC.1